MAKRTSKNTARFLKYVWPFYNIMHERVKTSIIGMWYNFQKYRPGEASTLGESYDKTSIMHYGK